MHAHRSQRWLLPPRRPGAGASAFMSSVREVMRNRAGQGRSLESRSLVANAMRRIAGGHVHRLHTCAQRYPPHQSDNSCSGSTHRRRRGGAFISSLHGVPPAFARALRLEALLATLGWAALATLAAAEVEVVRRFLRVLLRATTNGPISELLVPRGASHFGAVGFAALGRPVCDRVLDGNIEVVVDGFVEYVFVFWIARSAAGTTWEATAGRRAAGW